MDLIFIIALMVFLLFIFGYIFSEKDAKNSEKKRQERRRAREHELEQRIRELNEVSKSHNNQNQKTNFYGRQEFSDNYYGELKGKYAESMTAVALERLIQNDDSHIINNICLPLYDRTCEIDHLVIGKFGVLVVETKGQSGVITGGGKQLTQHLGRYTYELYNPQYQNKTHTDNVSYHLRKGNFRNVPVYGVVVFTSDDVVFPEGLGIRISQLPDYYRGLRSSNCNTEKVYEYFKRICVNCSSAI